MKSLPVFLFLCLLQHLVYTQSLIINEFQSSNDTTISDFEGDNPDWIELYNLADTAINIEGWFLSDDSLSPFKWKFPSVIIPSEEYILVFASDKDTVFPNGEVHTNFKIGNGEDPLLLNRPDSTLANMASVIDLQTDWSYGRYSDATNGWFYFDRPTPGEGNITQPYGDFAEPPIFSLDAGFYPADFYLEIMSQNPNDTIYFTLDGSPPNKESPFYTQPILMKNRANDPNKLSLIQTTLPGQGFYSWFPPSGVVYKFNVVRARVIKTGFYPSEIVTSSFIVDPDISTRYTFPIISLVTDSLNFFDDTIGIYKAGVGIDSSDWKTAHFAQEGMTWERPVHIELFEPNGLLKIEQNAGVRIHGSGSTTANIKSLRLYSRSQYGNESFDYKFFPKLDQSIFRTLLLRNSGNDFAFCYMRDTFMQSLVDSMGFDTQDYQPSIVFLNGEYWGIHYIMERYDKHYIEFNHGVTDDSLDFLEFSHDVIEGNALHYDAMTNFINSHNMSDSANYSYVKTLMDVDNYINYISSNIFFCQSDWPQNNIKYWRKRTTSYLKDAPYGHDGRWRWMLYDTDYGFGRVKPYNFDNINFILFQATGWSPLLMQNLIGNDQKPGNSEFRNQFINTLADMMNSNFKIERMLSRIDQFKTMLLPEMPDHIQRWNGIGNMTIWNSRFQVLIDFALNRPQAVRDFIVGNFPFVTGTAMISLNSNIENGKIKINRLTIDNQTLGIGNPNQPYPWSGTYFQGVPVQLIALPNSGYKFIGWLGGSNQDTLTINLSTDSTFTAIFERTQPIEGEIVINEINYHSPVNKDAGDWVELFNKGIFDFNTTGWKITTSSGFEAITPQFTLPINHFLVICSDSTKFHCIHPDVQNYVTIPDLSLDDSIETIYLFANEMLLDSVNFSSENPWPTKPDGKGPTLELIESTLDNCQPQNWQASYINGGTPGHINSSPVFAIRINEFMADNGSYIKSPEGIYADWIELYNPLDVQVNIGGLYLSDKKTNPTKYLVPSNSPSITAISPKGFLVLWADEKTIYGPLHLNFKLSKDGEFVGIFNANHQQFIDTITFGIQQTDETTGRIPDGKGDFIFFENPTIGEPNGLRQTIPINNGWSGISSYLTPYHSQLSEIFSDDLDKIIVLSNNSGIFWPDELINTLEEWNAGDCFFLKTTEPFDLNISAMTFAGDDFLIQQGWNLVPCLSTQIVNTSDLFETYDELIIVKEIAGTKVYWPLMGISTLEELTPGKAYLIKAIDSFELSFEGK